MNDRLMRLIERSNDPQKVKREIALYYHLDPAPVPFFTKESGAPPVLFSLDKELGKLADKKGLFLPDLSSFKTLSVFSDYSGDQRESDFLTYSLLFTGDDATGQFSEEMSAIRKKHDIPSAKTLSFKDMRYGPLKRALKEILSVIDRIPGLLFTLVVDKKQASLFGKTPQESAEWLLSNGFGPFKPKVAEKMLRVLYMVVYWSCVLGHEGQNFFWMTDHDDISANADHRNDIIRFVYAAFHQYCPNKFNHLGFAEEFPAEEKASVDFNALLSVPDLFAGALGPLLTQWKHGEPLVEGKKGASEIIYMLCHQGVFLKKFIFYVEPDGEGIFKPSIMNFSRDSEDEDAETILI